MSGSNPYGKILIVDDDKNIAELLRYNLTSEGYSVDIESNSSRVVLGNIPEYRLVIVDAMRQSPSGIELCNEIKTNELTESVPVIICAVPLSEDDIIRAFDYGTDDYIIKPFSLREFIARIKAVLRRYPMQANTQRKAANKEISANGIDLIINAETQKVLAKGEIVALTKTEFAILLLLFKHLNSFFTREEICSNVWSNDTSGNVRIVDTNISRLRKKLGEVGKHIINRYGMGYAFVEKVL